VLCLSADISGRNGPLFVSLERVQGDPKERNDNMIITRTPFRVTLGGGGTDLPSFYREHSGFILAVTIDKFMYLNVNTPIVDDIIRVQYSKTEIVNRAEEVRHTLVREVLQFFHIENGIQIASIADIPAGTGLGSSSSYLVGLLNAMHTLTRSPVSTQELAEEACQIELERLGKPIGKQDQYMAAFGGLTTLEITKDGRVKVSRPHLTMELVNALESNILLFYTGSTRDADAILRKQDGAAKKNEKLVVESLQEIKEIGIEIRDSIVRGNLRRVGELLDIHWQAKKRLSDGITNKQIDDWYELAKRSGAIGGKISGAGGGGFLMLYCEEGKQRLREAMRGAGLTELNFRFEFEGSKVVLDVVSRDGYLAHIHRQARNQAFQASPAVWATA
jgi:D-glycero-alpha-D-manno-heptose-7-phosphate kinase